MIDPLILRNHILVKLEPYLGKYILPSGTQLPAISVLPDPKNGWNYPEDGTKTNGLECVIKKPMPLGESTLGGGMSKEFAWEIHLKQWDSNQSLLEAGKILLDSLSLEYQINRNTYLPASDKLLTIEQYKVYIVDYEIFT
jgi:hypothetical protein